MIPDFKVTVGSTSVESDVSTLRVTLRENAVNNAKLAVANEESKHFLNICNLYDPIKIELKYRGSSYTEVLGGKITALKPGISRTGHFLGVECIANGLCVKRMRVAEEYGTESRRATLDTLSEILTDSTYGVVPKYVNKVLATATNSGYNLNTEYIYNNTTSLRYVYFPYTPVIDALYTLCDLLSAAAYPSAGMHWIIKSIANSPYLCIDTVANHHTPITTVWPTNADIGTLIQGDRDVNMGFEQKEAEANYIVYFGKFEKPTGERWTNNGASLWDKYPADANISNDSSVYVVGADSIKQVSTASIPPGGGIASVPSSKNMGLDITKIGTARSIPSISFYVLRHSDVNTLSIDLAVNSSNYFYTSIFSDVPNAGQWYHITLPVGPYYKTVQRSNTKWAEQGSPQWTNINYVSIRWNSSSANAYVNIDDLHFNGIVTRAAKSNTAIGDQDCQIQLITDSLAKDDILVATDDSGMVGQLAKAELIRAMTTPTIANITIDWAESLLPGQIQHIHAEKKADGTYRIDKDFRIQEITHLIDVTSGGLTQMVLTDDIINGYARKPTDQYGILLRATHPDFQTRNAGDFKGRDIDILQTILEKNY